MKIFGFGLATSNELRGGAKRWDNVRYEGGWVKKKRNVPISIWGLYAVLVGYIDVQGGYMLFRRVISCDRGKTKSTPCPSDLN